MNQIDTDLLFNHKFTTDMNFRSKNDKIECFRVMDGEGKIINNGGYHKLIDDATLKRIYETMVTINEADVVFNQAQRQSRISFYMTQQGEEAHSIGTAAALQPQDLMFPQYRESGAFLWRGFSIQQMAHQLCGNHKDLGAGKQMPVHYGSKELNISTVSSPLTTQVPQASGAGYKYRINGEDRIAMTFFGEGAASEGDFHSALNFAATLRCQTLFYCRNNMYAISTPIDDQYAGDGIAARGIAYGIPTIRVDGNDVFAVFAAVKKARELIIKEKRPALIESISYRQGDHSTSDFSAAYRNEKEMTKWQSLLASFSNPISRLEKYLLNQKLITADQNAQLRESARNSVRDALRSANQLPKPPIDSLFEAVYDKMPAHISEQREELRQHLKKYPEQYHLENFLHGKEWIK